MKPTKRQEKQIGIKNSLLKRRTRMSIRNLEAQRVREARAKRQAERKLLREQ